MVDSILGRGKYVNQAVAIAESTLTCVMARESAYSGMAITWDQIMASKQDLMSAKPGPLPTPGEYKFI